LNQTFGSFVRQKRMEQGLSLRGLAARLDLSPVYMSNIETGRKPAPARENLDKLTLELHLSKEEQELLLDLAARPETMRVSADLPEYIMERDIVRAALRTAKEVDATDEEWQEFIDRITKRTPSSRRDGP
jgi:transcriptional regulator with XRE-family HTH domain